jgi:hypothetical protein
VGRPILHVGDANNLLGSQLEKEQAEGWQFPLSLLELGTSFCPWISELRAETSIHLGPQAFILAHRVPPSAFLVLRSLDLYEQNDQHPSLSSL